jgi:hypothetical protein
MDSPKMLPVSEQMKAWSSALGAEIAEWPGVDARSFFGFTALYRRTYRFAALPRTRSWGTGNCLAFKVKNPTPRLRTRLKKDGRIGSIQMKESPWVSFELSSDADLHDALDWLGLAYDAARQPSRLCPRTGKKKKSK